MTRERAKAPPAEKAIRHVCSSIASDAQLIDDLVQSACYDDPAILLAIQAIACRIGAKADMVTRHHGEMTIRNSSSDWCVGSDLVDSLERARNNKGGTV